MAEQPVKPKKNIYVTLTTTSSAAQLVFNTQKGVGTAFGCSDEQIFSPVKISQYNNSSWSGGNPSFSTAVSQNNYGSTERGGFSSGSVGPGVDDLNPYYSNTLDNFFSGLDFIEVVNDSYEGLNIRKLSSIPSAVFTTGLRGPLIVSGWGYDLCDRPVPSSDGDTHDTDIGLRGNRAL